MHITEIFKTAAERTKPLTEHVKDYTDRDATRVALPLECIEENGQLFLAIDEIAETLEGLSLYDLMFLRNVGKDSKGNPLFPDAGEGAIVGHSLLLDNADMIAQLIVYGINYTYQQSDLKAQGTNHFPDVANGELYQRKLSDYFNQFDGKVTESSGGKISTKEQATIDKFTAAFTDNAEQAATDLNQYFYLVDNGLATMKSKLRSELQTLLTANTE